jgi:hypothetical protein
MPTTFVKGDFLAEPQPASPGRAVAFAADVSGKMEAGVAVAVKKRWPAIAAWWAERCADGKMQVGAAPKWQDGTDVVYALAIEKSGTKGKFSWLEHALQAMVADASGSGVTRIAIPRLWAGASGFDAPRAKRVLGEVGEGSPVDLVVFEQFVREKPPETS